MPRRPLESRPTLGREIHAAEDGVPLRFYFSCRRATRTHAPASVRGEQFLRELRLAASLQHAHTLPLYDSGQTADSLPSRCDMAVAASLGKRLDGGSHRATAAPLRNPAARPRVLRPRSAA